MKKKVLVIRFNSIGDIVLTSPVAKALCESEFEVHFLVKKVFADLVKPNPNVFKVWELGNNLEDIIKALKQVEFYAIVDLHNTIRSYKVVKSLNCSFVYKFKKPRLKYWMLTNLHLAVKPEAHIVDRFLTVIEPLVGEVKYPQTEFYFSDKLSKEVEDELPTSFVSIGVGAAFYTKTIPVDKIARVINQTEKPIVLLGGPNDLENTNQVLKLVEKPVVNLVGKISISESAHVISRSDVLISGDTGMMHIGAALGVRMINIFGSTHPILGYTPHYGNLENKSQIIQVSGLKCRPCTKQGRKDCPKGHFKCMNDVNVDEIVNII